MFPFSDFFWFDDSAYRFNRPMLERQGWYSKEKDGRLLVLLNVLGINEDDLNIEVTPADNGREAISISGTTKDEVLPLSLSPICLLVVAFMMIFFVLILSKLKESCCPMSR